MPSHEPLGYHELAAILRDQITSGVHQPGQKLPSERDLGQIYGSGRTTVRRAVEVLRREGLVVVRRGWGSYVRGSGKMEAMRIEAGCRVTARMPTPEEAKQHRIPEGAPVFVITRHNEPEQIVPADRIALEFGPAPRHRGSPS